MRFGFVGPAGSSSSLLERAVGQLVTELEVDTVVYLGADEAIRDFITAQQRDKSEVSFEQRVAQVAATGSAAEITEVVRSLRGARYLEKLRVLPEPPRTRSRCSTIASSYWFERSRASARKTS
ncbi:MAG: hypothetical protein OEM16_05405 [Myxococcales bacterium]|nr:hypothetical protein [Myxococcales bacterium]